MLLLFALISSLYGIFGLIVIRLATTLERQFVDVYESPAATNDRYQTVKNSLLVGVILLSYALFPIGRFVGIPFLFFFGWVIPGLGIAAVVLITPIAWALLRRRAL